MRFMVIERFKGGAEAVGKRFKERGRMLPDGVTYHASWVDVEGTRCFQIMEAANAEMLRAWIAHWDDLIDFEIIDVMSSGDFWQSMRDR